MGEENQARSLVPVGEKANHHHHLSKVFSCFFFVRVSHTGYTDPVTLSFTE
jgi:hypothetical protein